MLRLHLPRASYDLFVYVFLRVLGIIGMTAGYDLCVYINTAIVRFL